MQQRAPVQRKLFQGGAGKGQEQGQEQEREQYSFSLRSRRKHVVNPLSETVSWVTLRGSLQHKAWGSRPRLYAYARCAGCSTLATNVLGLTPQALCSRPLRGLITNQRLLLRSRPLLGLSKTNWTIDFGHFRMATLSHFSAFRS